MGRGKEIQMFYKVIRVAFLLAVMMTVFAHIDAAEAQIVTNGLVSYWSLDGDIKDAWGKNDGNGVGDPQVVEGKIGKAMQLDADGDFLDCGNDASLSFERTDKFSIQAWIKKEVDANQVIVGKMFSSDTYRGWLFWSRSGGQIGTVIRSDWPSRNLIEVNTVGIFSIAEWHHTVLTYDGSSKAEGVSIYVDGVNQELKPAWDALTDTMKNDLNVNIGAREGKSTFFNGAVDEVAIYNRVLSEYEVKQNFAADGIVTAVEATNKLSLTWGGIKAVK